jgi:hypothetical protein
MIDDQINTFMASDQFRRRAAELDPQIRADISLGKPVNLAAVPDELALGHGARGGRRQVTPGRDNKRARIGVDRVPERLAPWTLVIGATCRIVLVVPPVAKIVSASVKSPARFVPLTRQARRSTASRSIPTQARFP